MTPKKILSGPLETLFSCSLRVYKSLAMTSASTLDYHILFIKALQLYMVDKVFENYL